MPPRAAANRGDQLVCGDQSLGTGPARARNGSRARPVDNSLYAFTPGLPPPVFFAGGGKRAVGRALETAGVVEGTSTLDPDARAQT